MEDVGIVNSIQYLCTVMWMYTYTGRLSFLHVYTHMRSVCFSYNEYLIVFYLLFCNSFGTVQKIIYLDSKATVTVLQMHACEHSVGECIYSSSVGVVVDKILDCFELNSKIINNKKL